MTTTTEPTIVVFFDNDWDCPLWIGAAIEFLDIAGAHYHFCDYSGNVTDNQEHPIGHVREFLAQHPDQPIVWVGKNFLTDLKPRPHDMELLSIVDVFEWLWQRRREL